MGLWNQSCSTKQAEPEQSAPVPSAKTAVIETDYGKIKITFFPDFAPRHVQNFAKLAREGFYDGLAFHRVVPGLLIQGGDPNTRDGDPGTWGMGQPGQPTVPAEFNAKPFVRGTLGMARKGDPNSATSQFFICLRDNPRWNGQYTVFGEVTEGIEVVDLISREPIDPVSQKTVNKIVMKRVTVEN
ncbi:MAG TPA: peptidylprolyl isomerase [Blastocatellia bacterium]|nr:peptidylprolyl isomerase [Blastocatellia bacterium]